MRKKYKSKREGKRGRKKKKWMGKMKTIFTCLKPCNGEEVQRRFIEEVINGKCLRESVDERQRQKEENSISIYKLHFRSV